MALVDDLVERHFNELLGRLVSAACQPESATGAALGRYTRDANAWGRKYLAEVIGDAIKAATPPTGGPTKGETTDGQRQDQARRPASNGTGTQPAAQGGGQAGQGDRRQQATGGGQR